MDGNVSKEGITADLEAMASAGVGGAQIFNVGDGIPAGKATFGGPLWFEMVAHAHKEARRVGVELCIHNCAGWANSGGAWNTPENAMKVIATSELKIKGPAAVTLLASATGAAPALKPGTSDARKQHVLARPKAHKNFYEDIALIAFPTLKGASKIPNFAGKTFFVRGNVGGNITAAAGAVIDEKQVRVLWQANAVAGAKRPVSPEGKTFALPAGDWTVLRVGYTANGRTNHPTPPGGRGLEVDKLSRVAVKAHWDGHMAKVIAAAKGAAPLDAAQKAGLNNVLIDSYEVGSQNWTRGFERAFRERRGYDITPFLPVFTGKVVGSPEITERFLWDFRRVVADMFAEIYSGYFGEIAHKNGLLYSIEPYGNCPSDDIQYGGYADVPMAEFWQRIKGSDNVDNAKLGASIGHVYGRKYIGAEAFTSRPRDGRWTRDAFGLKPQNDAALCAGINRMIYHRYAHQPWLDRVPGMTMGQWGTHFERTLTWWKQGAAWLTYQARCQYLLQEGRFVADVLYYAGEDAPNSGERHPGLKGYDYDVCDTSTLARLRVTNEGKLLLPNGISYYLLALPDSEVMSPAVLEQVKRLADAGAKIIGRKPTRAPGLVNFPDSDTAVRSAANKLWGEGKGKVSATQTVTDVLQAGKLAPDFTATGSGTAKLRYIHRDIDGTDVYFIATSDQLGADVEATFRVTGKTPEFWHPDSGRIETAPIWRVKNGRTTLPIRLDPCGSVFVIFRKTAANANHLVSAEFRTGNNAAKPSPDLKIVKAEYGTFSGKAPRSKDVTAAVAAKVSQGVLTVAAANTEFGDDPAPKLVKELRVQYTLDGKPAKATAVENTVLCLPPGSADPTRNIPNYELRVPGRRVNPGNQGGILLNAWKPGEFVATFSDGKTITRKIATLPDPVAIDGKWELTFPPKLGAPAKVTLDKLLSWTDHPDTGVKYFSGTATYSKTFRWNARSGREIRYVLDLGALKNFAEVELNGHPFPVLWKPPYRHDVTRWLKEGDNTLTIKITNTWVNRLIGDEQLPDDRDWENRRSIPKWPDWLLQGKPSPTGRITFTTWHHWRKHDKPLPSGLFGPVQIHTITRTLVR
jgi:hypothetical protein